MPSTVAPPKPNIGLISAMTAAGKSRDGVDDSLRAGVLKYRYRDSKPDSEE
jgi:hypothetical protein